MILTLIKDKSAYLVSNGEKTIVPQSLYSDRDAAGLVFDSLKHFGTTGFWERLSRLFLEANFEIIPELKTLISEVPSLKYLTQKVR